uniref:Solute carrier family 66 member 3 n=1 Tax=Strigops habroptila TaxID=2489341 RepID=A0A672UAM9_STRHB
PLELLVLARSVAYGCSRAFPFSAWGEVLFLLLQTMTLGFLMQHLEGTREEVNGVCGAPMGMLLGTLLSPHTTPGLITFLQAANLPIIILTTTNYSQGHTGQLSGVTTTLLFGGETEDPFLTLTFATSAACNGLLLGQLLYYGGGRGETPNLPLTARWTDPDPPIPPPMEQPVGGLKRGFLWGKTSPH